MIARKLITIDMFRTSDIDRFWAKVSKSSTSSCWGWRASTSKLGYGRFKLSGEVLLAHRVSYVLSGCELHEGLVLDHECENRSCVNPRHLREVEFLRNVQNRSRQSSSASRYRGVSISTRGWHAQAWTRDPGGSRCHHELGTYAEESTAAVAVALFWRSYTNGNPPRNTNQELVKEVNW